MSAAAMAGRVGGPTYLSGNSLGIAGAAVATLGAAASVDRDADEQAPSAMANHESTDRKDFTHAPRKEEAGVGCRSLPRRLLDQHDRFGSSQFFPFVPAGSPPCKIPAGACGLSGIPGTASIFFWRGHTSSNVLPS